VDGYIVRWFDHFLKGIDNGVEKDAPVYVFFTGENVWHAEQDWPLPEAKPTRYYLVSAGHANSLKGDGVLTTHPPATDTPDSYIYNPLNPTLDPFENYPNHSNLDGPLDTRLSTIGDEVLVYKTAPLASPVEVTGPIEATLYAATSALDTDWFIRLIDVQPDERSLLLCDGSIRARNRDPANAGRFNPAHLSTIDPGKVYEYHIEFWRGTGNLFQKRSSNPDRNFVQLVSLLSSEPKHRRRQRCFGFCLLSHGGSPDCAPWSPVSVLCTAAGHSIQDRGAVTSVQHEQHRPRFTLHDSAIRYHNG
jgi:uncharacterized protein